MHLKNCFICIECMHTCVVPAHIMIMTQTKTTHTKSARTMEEVHGRPRMMWMDVVKYFGMGEHKNKVRESTNEQGARHIGTHVNDGF